MRSFLMPVRSISRCLHLREQGGRIVHHVAQVVYLLRVAGAYQPAVVERDGRVGVDGAQYFLAHVLERVHVRYSGEQDAPAPGEQLLYTRQGLTACGQREQVPGVGRLIAQARGHALHVAYAVQGRAELAAQDVVLLELAHGSQALKYVLRLEQRHLHPGAERARAHRGFGAVEHAQQAAGLCAGAQVGRQLKAAPGLPVQLHVPVVLAEFQAVYVRHVALLRVGNVLQQRAAGE